MVLGSVTVRSVSGLSGLGGGRCPQRPERRAGSPRRSRDERTSPCRDPV